MTSGPGNKLRRALTRGRRAPTPKRAPASPADPPPFNLIRSWIEEFGDRRAHDLDRQIDALQSNRLGRRGTA